MDTFLPPVSLSLTLFSVLSSTSNTRPLFSLKLYSLSLAVSAGEILKGLR